MTHVRRQHGDLDLQRLQVARRRSGGSADRAWPAAAAISPTTRHSEPPAFERADAAAQGAADVERDERRARRCERGRCWFVARAAVFRRADARPARRRALARSAGADRFR
jgi:hypothetical protein